MDSRIKSVTFNEEEHRYFFNGTELHGVTGAIGKRLNKVFPEGIGYIEVGREYGHQLHKDVEKWFNDNNHSPATEGSMWVIDVLEDLENTKGKINKIECEVTVSDFVGTASKVDIVAHCNEGVYLFDIKTTSHFDREYCSLQLSVYSDLYERNYGETVLGLFVLSTKAKRMFRIIHQGSEKVEKILAMNKEYN